jgi:hypothetical protein
VKIAFDNCVLQKSEPSQPLDDETVKKMKALVDYIVEYEDR